MSCYAAIMLIAVVSLLMAGPVAAQNVLMPNEESGIPNATHTWTDADGNVLGFSIVAGNFTILPAELTLCGIVPAGEPTSITIPDLLTLDGKEMSVVSISEGAFQACTKLNAVTLPATLVYVNYQALNGCPSLTDIYCRSFLPPLVAENQTTASNEISGINLHVPALAMGDYANANFWSDFENSSPLANDVNLVSLYADYTLTDLTGIAPNADLRITSNRVNPQYYSYFYGWIEGEHTAHVDVQTAAPWQLGNFFMAQTTEYRKLYWNSEMYYYRSEPEGFVCTLIPQSEMTATGDVTVQLDCRNKGWKFFSLPFDVYMGDISVSHNASWVIRRFSPRERSVLGNTWQNVGPRDTLRANTGYIIYTMTSNADDPPLISYEADIPVLTAKAANNAKKQGLFATGDVTVPLVQTDAILPQDQNWNFIGNPYPAFYDMSQSDFTAPYTIWSRMIGGNYYETYSPIDDDFFLRPFEGFFVQCPYGVNSITFQPSGRMHSWAWTYRWVKHRAPALQNRQLYNIFLSAGEFSDRARIVVNPEAREGYELERDASKMMVTNAAVPQIYVIDGGINYAIDERPLGSGQFILGTSFANAGEYTIRLETRGEAQTAILTDRLTGEAFDLTQGESYTFFAEAGTANDRFTLTIGDDATDIDAVDNGPMVNGQWSNGKWYNLNGQRVSRPANGIYVKQGKKYIIK